jgi:PAS domain S-box-containing protein
MSRRPSLPRPLAARVAAAVVALVGLMLALLAGLWQHHHNQSTTARAFDRLADSTVQQIQMRLMRYDAGLHGLRGAVLAAGGRSLRLEQMRAYIDSREMDREFPGARGFGVIWRVSPAQEAAFVAAARADGRPDFQVQQINPHDGERRVITFVEPVSRNQAALGLDVASEPNRLRSTVQSTLSGEATLTGPITLLQARGQTSRGLLLTLPIYRYGAPLDSAAAREAATLGWAYAPLVVDEVLDRLPGDGQQFLLSLIDLASSAAGESSPLYASHPTPPLQPDAMLPAAERSFDVQGRRWQARLHATPEFVAGLNTIEPVRVTLGIALLAALLAVVVYQLMQDRARALRERLGVARRAAIVEGSEDAIIGASLEGVITEWNGGAERLFGYSADEALGGTIEELLLPPDRMAEDVQFRATIASGRRVPPFDTLRRHRDGSLIAV